jgi:hypothetical protein
MFYMLVYKMASIISGAGAAVWTKTNFVPLGHHSPRSSSLPLICTVPSDPDIFKCILEVSFCEGVQHRLRFYLDHLNFVKTAAFQAGKKRKVLGSQVIRVGWLEKESVRRCIVVMQQPVLLWPKFWAKSSHIFTQCRIYCLACQDKLFLNNPVDVK